MRANLLLLLLTFTASWVPAFSDQLIYADGRREPIEQPRKDSKGQWLGTRDGRLMVIKAGEVAAIVNDQGVETSIIPELRDGALPAASEVLLSQFCAVANDAWRASLETLCTPPLRGVHDALLELSADKRKELRTRAIWGLCALHTKASVLAAAEALLAEKDAGMRREQASALFSVKEIFRRCDGLALVERGLSDADAGVRFVFAMLSPHEHAGATKLLREESLKNRDHHVRESAALELGERGDASGESILVAMLARNRLPGVDDPALMQRLLLEEHLRVIAVLGSLGTKRAQAALALALKSSVEAERKAAQAALDSQSKK
jgi:HEAT repeat protein